MSQAVRCRRGEKDRVKLVYRPGERRISAARDAVVVRTDGHLDRHAVRGPVERGVDRHDGGPGADHHAIGDFEVIEISLPAAHGHRVEPIAQQQDWDRSCAPLPLQDAGKDPVAVAAGRHVVAVLAHVKGVGSGAVRNIERAAGPRNIQLLVLERVTAFALDTDI